MEQENLHSLREQVARQAQRIMTIRDGVLSGGDSHE